MSAPDPTTGRPATGALGREDAGAIDLDALGRDAEAAARALRASGGWGDDDDARLAERFEIAAEQALRVPALGERAALLRELGRRFVPEAARPLVWRAVRRADSLARAGFALLERQMDTSRR